MKTTRHLTDRPEFWGASALAILAAATFFRFHAIGRADYWIDEMVSLNIAKSSQLSSIFWDNSPPLYHLLLKIWVRLVGDSEFATRFLSAVFSVATTATIMWMAREFLGSKKKLDRSLPLIAGGLHAVCFLSIEYAQETRMYALFELLAALNLLSYLKLFRKPTQKNLIVYAAISCLLLMTHYLAWVPLFLQVVIAMLGTGPPDRKKHRPHKISVWVPLMGASAIIAQIIFCATSFKWEGLTWQTLKYHAEPSSRWPFELLFQLSYNAWPFVLVLAALIVFLWVARTRDLLNLWKQSEFRIYLILIGGPLAFACVASVFAERSIFLSRYFIYLIPAWVLLLTQSLNSLRPFSRRAFAILLITAGFSSIPALYNSPKEPWRAVANTVAQYPRTLILTSRTVAIRVPYFEKQGMEVEKWNPKSPHSNGAIEYLASQVAKRGRVWIIENYWGGLPYMDELKTRLQGLGFHIADASFRTENSPPIWVMMVEAGGRAGTDP